MEGHVVSLDTYRDDSIYNCGFCAEGWYNINSSSTATIQWQGFSPPAHDGMETRTACNASSTEEHHILLLLVCSLQAQSPSSQVCHQVKELRCLSPVDSQALHKNTTAWRLRVACQLVFLWLCALPAICAGIAHYVCMHCPV